MSDIRIIVFVLALLTAAPWAMIGAPSAQEQATSQAGPPVEAVREAQALLAGLGYAPGSTGADTWNESLSRAYRAFLRDAGLPTSEMLTPRGLRRLREVARSEGVAAGSGAPGGPAPEPASDGLHRAVMVGDMDGARALLLRGAAVDGRDGRGWTPLMHAAHKGYVLLVEMLLQSGASPDVRAPDGATALFMAVLNGHPEAIALLMRAGASVSVLGPRGLTPADAARLLYGNNQGQRPVPDDAAIHALLAGMTWGDAVKAAVAGRREETNAATSEASLGLDRKTRAHVQRRLSELGFSPGPDDGVFGRRTRLAIGAWQESEGFVRTGYLTRKQTDTLVALGEDVARAEAEDRHRAEEEKRRRAKEEERARQQAEAERRADDEAFTRAKGLDTAAAYEEYLEARPDGHHVVEARRLRDESSQVKQAGEVFRDCEECPELVVVPAGSYMMGSPYDDEVPVHEVRIGKPFAVGVYEVTHSEWEACVSGGGCGGYRPSDEGWGRGNRPVINVSWEDARSYVSWLSRRTDEDYRLLSEAEWEYVARAGTTTPFFFGATLPTDQANYDGNYTYPVGSFESNRFGLHDVHGNVWEWVQDCWNNSYHGAPLDGSAWEGGDCSLRVLRGGSWDMPDSWPLRSASRVRDSTENLYDNSGFRIARTLSP